MNQEMSIEITPEGCTYPDPFIQIRRLAEDRADLKRRLETARELYHGKVALCNYLLGQLQADDHTQKEGSV